MLRLLLACALVSSAFGARFRIVNGKEGEIKNFPYLAALIHRGVIRGGSTIIGERTVITAAHCFKNIVLEKFFVHVGSEWGERLSEGATYAVESYLGHPDYNALTQNNDIGIVWTKEKIVMGPNVKPIPLAKAGAPLPIGAFGVASGWGRMSENGPFADKLQYTTLPILERSKCVKSGGGGYDDFRITDKMFCAGYLDGRTDACKSDSGGPFVIDNTLVGVISFGQGCARKNFPGVYANVAVFRQWIDEELKKHEKA